MLLFVFTKGGKRAIQKQILAGKLKEQSFTFRNVRTFSKLKMKDEEKFSPFRYRGKRDYYTRGTFRNI